MANTFLRKSSANVTTVTTIGSYTVGASTQTVVIGLRITNVTASAIKASVALNNGGTPYYLVGGATNSTMGADIPVGSSLVVVNGDADKLVMITGDSISVVASGNADCSLSILEIT